MATATRKPPRKPILHHVTRGNVKRARIRSRVKQILAAQKRRIALVIRTSGRALATSKLALANLAYDLSRFLWPKTRQAA